MPNMLGIKNAA